MILRVLFLSFVFFGGGWFGCKTPQSPPNILFILGDDHTSQAWGLYGSVLDSLVQNHHIRRLAEEGTLLNNVFCTNSICVPSRATILTGQYSHLNGVYTLSEGLDPEKDHVAKILQQGGYETAIIGKWHLKEKPSGFDYYNVLPGQGRYHNPILKTAENWEEGKEYKGFSADVIGDLAVEWLENRKNDQPFFLMCHFKATHEPFDYPERYKELYSDVLVPEPENLLDFGTQTSGRVFSGQVLEILQNRYEMNQGNRYPGPSFSVEGLDSIEARRKVYQKFVKDFMRSGAAINDNIGKLLDWLDRVGETENTVVIYTSDQGYFIGEHGFMDKRMMYEESLRMPFVIRFPEEIKAGKKLDDMILNTDFAPLFLDYAELSQPGYMQGRSFRKNLQGKSSEDWRTQMYYRYWLHQKQRPAHFGLRNDRYKLIFYYGQPLDLPGTHSETTDPSWEFYDLSDDPHENINQYRNPKYSNIISQMKKDLLEEKERVGDKDENFPIVNQIIKQNW
ncbi:MAG: sulfatase [Bacteroidetes bacterium]|nr:sulfatase [Bacteroidota bacterium]